MLPQVVFWILIVTIYGVRDDYPIQLSQTFPSSQVCEQNARSIVEQSKNGPTVVFDGNKHIGEPTAAICLKIETISKP
jgi:hypothetical protein